MEKGQAIQAFQTIRQQTVDLCRPLSTEDFVIQSISDVSPPKWHLAHSTWFYETFILSKFLANYCLFNPSYHYLFNSYYQGLGQPFPRDKRGLLSRPGVEEIYSYRDYVDQHILKLLDLATEDKASTLDFLLKLGMHHEQQHQELLLMDIKHNFSIDPNFPSYKNQSSTVSNNASKSPFCFIDVAGGLVDIGCFDNEFCFDNEKPRHKKFLTPYRIANQLVTNAEYLEFIRAGSYTDPQWWLADGWDYVLSNNWQAPLYWHNLDNEWFIFTLDGLKPLHPDEPVCHVSYYEAEAFARWRGARLATEEEWEHFVRSRQLRPVNHHFMESALFHPQVSSNQDKNPQQFFGDLWEWTSSPYTPYPGYSPTQGPLGEYNGKFMANQMVLRGGCCITPVSHIRTSYRNFFQPEKRWQFSGIRLAKNSKD